MNISAKAAVAAAFFGLLLETSLFTSPTAQAITAYAQDQGGPACQLSVPTTASEVRPRASGMRNEGSTSAFVICQFPSTGGFPYTNATLYIVSIDGKDHTVQCTGMSGYVTYEPKYSTKTYLVASNLSDATDFRWNSDDFGAHSDLGSAYFSVTCNLPPGTSIVKLNASYYAEIGA